VNSYPAAIRPVSGRVTDRGVGVGAAAAGAEDPAVGDGDAAADADGDGDVMGLGLADVTQATTSVLMTIRTMDRASGARIAVPSGRIVPV
jgi:hypothetical protein